MSVIRLIFVKLEPAELKEALHVWKQDCAPLMIKQRGCLSEKLLTSNDNLGELISYSEWDSEGSIEAFRHSPAHEEIMRHSERLRGRVDVKHYTLAT